MKIKDAHILWTPLWWEPRQKNPRVGTARVYDVRYSPPGRLFAFDDGAVRRDWAEWTTVRRERELGVLFVIMTVRDGLAPQVVHEAFLAIDEYRQNMISSDTPGATDENDNLYVKEKKSDA